MNIPYADMASMLYQNHYQVEGHIYDFPRTIPIFFVFYTYNWPCNWENVIISIHSYNTY